MSGRHAQIIATFTSRNVQLFETAWKSKKEVSIQFEEEEKAIHGVSTAATAGPTTDIRTTVQAIILGTQVSSPSFGNWKKGTLQETKTEHQT